MERLMRKKTKTNKNHSRTEDNNAQGTKANAKTKTQIANDILEPHAAWTCAVQATGGRGKIRGGADFAVKYVACSIYS